MSRKGFTLIELLISMAIVAILILAVLFIYNVQINKGRDSKRKADLAKLQRLLEDYSNDNDGCYPESLEDDENLADFKDPIDSGDNIYYYSVSSEGECKKWYRIFTTLDYDEDPIIDKIACTPDTCANFNYVVTSPNIGTLPSDPSQAPPGAPTSTPTGSGSSPAPTSSITPTATLTPTITPTPTPTSPCPGGMWFTCVDQGGFCNASYEGAEGAVCSSNCNFCAARSCRAWPDCVP